MHRKTIELGALSAIQFIGWLSLLGWVVLILDNLKSSASDQLYFVYGLPILLLVGYVGHFGFHTVFFTEVSKSDARRFFSPYKVGAFVFLLLLLVFNGFKWL